MRLSKDMVLKERAAYLIGKIKNASAGKVLAIYSVIRTIASALNIRIGGVGTVCKTINLSNGSSSR